MSQTLFFQIGGCESFLVDPVFFLTSGFALTVSAPHNLSSSVECASSSPMTLAANQCALEVQHHSPKTVFHPILFKPSVVGLHPLFKSTLEKMLFSYKLCCSDELYTTLFVIKEKKKKLSSFFISKNISCFFHLIGLHRHMSVEFSFPQQNESTPS